MNAKAKIKLQLNFQIYKNQQKNKDEFIRMLSTHLGHSHYLLRLVYQVMLTD